MLLINAGIIGLGLEYGIDKINAALVYQCSISCSLFSKVSYLVKVVLLALNQNPHISNVIAMLTVHNCIIQCLKYHMQKLTVANCWFMADVFQPGT